MQRNAMESLIKWKNLSERSPLLLRGARQVGKTFLVRDFAARYFPSFLEINFERQIEYRHCFERSLDANEIVRSIEFISRQKIIPHETLLFFDEIQECPRAIQALRYFKEQRPDVHIISAGSLIEFVLKEADFSFPVGRIEYLFLKPLSFQEFLYATNHQSEIEMIKEASTQQMIPSPLHHKLLELVQHYHVVGGMPAAVDAYIKTYDMERVSQIQSSLLQTYRDDFGKYATKTEHRHLQQIFLRLPGVIAQQFKYVDIDRELRAYEIKRAIESLEYAGLLIPVYANAAAGLPLVNFKIEKKYKCLFLDIGLVHKATAPTMYGALQPFNATHHLNQGALTEQFVGQELMAYAVNYEPAQMYYWQREKAGSSAEVDYLLAYQNDILPIEVKAGPMRHLKSLKILMEEKKLPLGVCIQQGILEKKNNILSVPLYMISELGRLVDG